MQPLTSFLAHLEVIFEFYTFKHVLHYIFVVFLSQILLDDNNTSQQDHGQVDKNLAPPPLKILLMLMPVTAVWKLSSLPVCFRWQDCIFFFIGRKFLSDARVTSIKNHVGFLSNVIAGNNIAPTHPLKKPEEDHRYGLAS